MPRRSPHVGRVGNDLGPIKPVERRIALLTIGGAIHALLLWQAAVGLLTIVITAVRPVWEGGGAAETYSIGIWAAAYVLVAYPFGWFCLRVAGDLRPWRAATSAILCMLPLAAIVVVIYAWNAERVRHEIYAGDTDPVATFFVSGCAVACLGAFGAAQFVVLGRRSVRGSSVVNVVGA